MQACRSAIAVRWSASNKAALKDGAVYIISIRQKSAPALAAPARNAESITPEINGAMPLRGSTTLAGANMKWGAGAINGEMVKPWTAPMVCMVTRCEIHEAISK